MSARYELDTIHSGAFRHTAVSRTPQHHQTANKAKMPAGHVEDVAGVVAVSRGVSFARGRKAERPTLRRLESMATNPPSRVTTG